MSASTPIALLRPRGPRWLHRAVGLLGFTLFWPVVRWLDLTGRWPRSVCRVMNRLLGNFGSYQPCAHDVLVCAYFKSGTNWTMHIALQIAHRGRACFEHIHEWVAWPEVPVRSGRSIAVPIGDDRPWRESPTGLRVIKTHLPLGKVPYSPSARYICVVRDPKDVFVSSFHFVRDTMLGRLMPSKEKWLQNFLSPDAMSGSWAEHLHSYWQARDRPNVLFLTYEEMQRDLPAAVERIAALMNVSLSGPELTEVVRQATFAHMKSIAQKFEVGVGLGWSGSARRRSIMIRRGESGTSKELLSADEQRRIDTYWRAELERLGCDFDYPAAFNCAPECPAPQNTDAGRASTARP